jgi:succinate dehydrogenase / fumarate reductase membrane anchor subunit
MTQLSTPLSRVRGWGSAKDGTHHFIAQRLSAIALIPLSLWFVVSIIFFINKGDHANLVTWIQSPWNAELLILFISFLFWHTYIGLQEIFKDYVHHKVLKAITLVSLKFFVIILTVASLWAVLRIALGG